MANWQTGFGISLIPGVKPSETLNTVKFVQFFQIVQFHSFSKKSVWVPNFSFSLISTDLFTTLETLLK